jgi:DNA-directed RNA polymerase specialized sigma24 family protein
MYIKYNEYELIYLYKEHNEYALELLFKKYENLIKKMVFDKYLQTEQDDAIQEMYIVLYDCIRLYQMSSKTPFINYLLIAFKHKTNLCKRKDISNLSLVRYNDDIIYNNYMLNEEDDSCIYNGTKNLCELEKKIVDEIIVYGMSPQVFAKNHSIDLKKVYNMTYRVKQKLRKSIILK